MRPPSSQRGKVLGSAEAPGIVQVQDGARAANDLLHSVNYSLQPLLFYISAAGVPHFDGVDQQTLCSRCWSSRRSLAGGCSGFPSRRPSVSVVAAGPSSLHTRRLQSSSSSLVDSTLSTD